jgi:hypothetical protein
MTVYACMKFCCTKNGVSTLLETAVLIGNCFFNPLNAELNPIRHLLALLGTHYILHVSRIRVKDLTKWRAPTVQGNGKYSTIPYYFLHNKMFAFNILRDANIPLQLTWTLK